MQKMNIIKLRNFDDIKGLISDNKEKIKTAALPFLVGIAVLFFWFYGGSGDEVQVSQSSADSNAAASAGSGSAVGSASDEGLSASATDGDIYVDIDGEVNNPGVYKVSGGTRLFQVIEMAGGLTERAATDSLNRAEEVYDGQKITVYGISGGDGNSENYADSGTTGNVGTGSGASTGITNGRVNINLADSATLQTIPGIGPSKAERIIEYRNTQGHFTKIEDIKNITGIGDKTFESIKNYITV